MMSSGCSSGLTIDDSETTDDDDSESSSGSRTPVPSFDAASANEQTLEKFYHDWRKEVEKKLLDSVKDFERSTLPVHDVSTLTVSPKDFSSQALGYLECSGTHSQDDSAADDSCDDLPVAVLDPEDEPHQQTHISALPHELLLRIFRWAVGSHLDTRILGRLPRVCRGFYLLAHDSSLWRSICLRLWPPLLDRHGLGVKGEHLAADIPHQYGYKDWRDMAINRPHVLLDGCYLCRITYVRPGEALSGIYRPMHLVVYYRGIRFYPDGRVNMLTSYHAPNAVVAALGKPFALTQRDVSTVSTGTEVDMSGVAQDSLGASGGGMLQGTYVLVDPDLIVCTLFRPRNKEKSHPFRRRRQPQLFNPEQQITYNIRFKLSSSRKRLHNVLRWDSYTIRQLNTTTQTDQLITLNVFSDQFPECRFSPVRSYVSTVASEPL